MNIHSREAKHGQSNQAQGRGKPELRGAAQGAGRADTARGDRALDGAAAPGQRAERGAGPRSEPPLAPPSTPARCAPGQDHARGQSGSLRSEPRGGNAPRQGHRPRLLLPYLRVNLPGRSMSNDYLSTVRDVYAAAAVQPDASLCCVAGTTWSFPDLHVPASMLEMNYGCGSTVHPSDLSGDRPVLYVGVGGGLEALQFAYFRRRTGGVIAVEPVAEMRAAAERNLREAAGSNPWFEPE